MRPRRLTLFALSAVCLSALTVSPMKANLLPFLASTAPGTGGNTVFNYSVSLSPDERIDGKGSGVTAFFTIYDFAGYVAGSAFSSDPNWTVSVQNLGITPVGVTPPTGDDANIVNLTFTYVGVATIDGTGQTFTGFGAESIYNQVTNNGGFSQQSTKNAGPAIGGRDFGGGPEEVPLASTATPEPASMLLLGSGLLVVGFAGKKFRRNRS